MMTYLIVKFRKPILIILLGFLTLFFLFAAAFTTNKEETKIDNKKYIEVASQYNDAYNAYIDWRDLKAVDKIINKGGEIKLTADKFLKKINDYIEIDFTKYVTTVDNINREMGVNLDWRQVLMYNACFNSPMLDEAEIKKRALEFIQDKKVLTLDEVLKKNNMTIDNIPISLRDVNKITQNFRYDFEIYGVKTISEIGKELNITAEKMDRIRAIRQAINLDAVVVFPANGKFAFPSPKAMEITSKYGQRFHPIEQIWKMHWGIDLGDNKNSPLNSPVLSIYDGVVEETKPNDELVGNIIKIKHNVDGVTWHSRYLHLNAIMVTKGQNVVKGQQIGLLGSTGKYSTGPHLHFEIYPNGQITDPEPFLFGGATNGN